jgi:hypothetical protein
MLDHYLVRDLEDNFRVIFQGTYDQCRAYVEANPPKPGCGYETIHEYETRQHHA